MTGRAAAVTAAALALAGCEEPTTNTATADVANAARAAQTDIDEYAANRAATTFVPPVAPTPRPPAQQAQAITPDDVLDEEAPERPGNTAARR